MKSEDGEEEDDDNADSSDVSDDEDDETIQVAVYNNNPTENVTVPSVKPAEQPVP